MVRESGDNTLDKSIVPTIVVNDFDDTTSRHVCIDAIDRIFMKMSSDIDFWVLISTAGSKP